MFKLLLTISLIALMIFTVQSSYGILDDEEIEEPVLPQARCVEHACSRIYRPLCISIEGKQKTVPSRCHFNNLRCHAMKRSQADARAVPHFRVMHEGSC